jgi:hypothetical protein
MKEEVSNMNRKEILKLLETRLPSCSKFEEIVIKHIQENYFAFVYQAMYMQLGYKERNNKFTNQEFKELYPIIILSISLMRFTEHVYLGKELKR